jgi:lipopolysaccharide/colanic/teichoic acid biosynthesis glycosyltransferase
LKALIVPAARSTRSWADTEPLAAVRVGGRQQLDVLAKWLRSQGAGDVHLVLADLFAAPELSPLCRRLGVHLHLCHDRGSLGSHLAWMAAQTAGFWMVVPEDFHPTPDLPGDLSKTIRRAAGHYSKPDAGCGSETAWIRVVGPEALGQLAGSPPHPAELEGSLCTDPVIQSQTTVLETSAVLLRDPAERLKVSNPASDNPAPRRAVRTKAFLERMMAALLLTVCMPVIGVAALAVKLDSPGSSFYRQQRMGADWRRVQRTGVDVRRFEVFKLRTMRTDAESLRAAYAGANSYGDGPFFKLTFDPRITRLGRLLRRTSLDELPQLANVVRGEMLLIGNRPLPLDEAAELDADWQRLRFAAPAGVTGLWQVLGRKDSNWRRRLFLDNYYAIHRSFWLDTRILVLTLPALIRVHQGS